MDMMEIRRRVMMNMASGAKVKTGSFIGDGTTTVELDVGFKPDIVIIDCDLNFSTEGWVGAKNITIVRNTIVYQSRHNNATSTTPNTSINYKIGGEYPEYGAAESQYGIYENGKFTIVHPNSTIIYRFITDQTYNWVAIKYT